MKFVYACDIHGDKNKYEKLLDMLCRKNIEYLVLGGDLLPKLCNRRVEQPKFIDNYLNAYFKKFQENNKKIICILGNDDIELIDKKFNDLCNKYSNIHNIDGRDIIIDDVQFIGMSKVLDHPFGSKDRVVIEKGQKIPIQLSETIKYNGKVFSICEWLKLREKMVDSMENNLENLPKANKDKKTIYVFHNPPYGIGLDVCSNESMVGSKSMKDFIEKSNCFMSLHGHIHESPDMSNLWYNRLRNTICIQPGQAEKDSETFYYVLIDTEKETFERYVGYIFS